MLQAYSVIAICDTSTRVEADLSRHLFSAQ